MIAKAIEKRLSNLSDELIDSIADKVAIKKIEEMSNTIVDSLGFIDKKREELNKISRSDVITYVNGEKVESMSSKRYDDIKRIEDKISKVESQIDKCLKDNQQNEYESLKKLISQNGGENKEQTSNQ